MLHIILLLLVTQKIQTY